MKPILLVLGAGFFVAVALYGKKQKPFWVFQAVMLPIFLYFFGADVMFGKDETTSSLWFLPFVLIWFVGSAGFGLVSLKHLLKEAAE